VLKGKLSVSEFWSEFSPQVVNPLLLISTLCSVQSGWLGTQ